MCVCVYIVDIIFDEWPHTHTYTWLPCSKSDKTLHTPVINQLQLFFFFFYFFSLRPYHPQHTCHIFWNATLRYHREWFSLNTEIAFYWILYVYNAFIFLHIPDVLLFLFFLHRHSLSLFPFANCLWCVRYVPKI